MEQLLKRLVVSILRLFVRPDPRKDTRPPQSILVVRQHDQLGDMLCTVPLLRALRSAFTKAKIVVVARPLNAAIMLHHPYLDDVLVYDKVRIRRSPLALLRFARALKTIKADLAVVPSTVSFSLTSDIIALYSGAAQRVGAASLRGVRNPAAPFFTDSVDLDWMEKPTSHQTRRNLDVLKPLSISTADTSITIGITDAERMAAHEMLSPLLSRHKVLVGIHPGAGKIGNRWPAARFAQAALTLAGEFSAGIVVTIGPMDESVDAEIQALLPDNALFIRHQPIRLVAAIIAQLGLFITNDTGIMHVAGGVGAPTLALFGPTDPEQWFPTGGKNEFLSGNGGNISSISVYEVVEKARKMLNPPR